MKHFAILQASRCAAWAEEWHHLSLFARIYLKDKVVFLRTRVRLLPVPAIRGGRGRSVAQVGDGAGAGQVVGDVQNYARSGQHHGEPRAVENICFISFPPQEKWKKGAVNYFLGLPSTLLLQQQGIFILAQLKYLSILFNTF